MSDKAKYAVLFKSKLDHYSPISDSSFAKLWDAVMIKFFPKGEFLLRLGDTAKKIYFVCEGLLISQYLKKDGSVHIKNFFMEGFLAGSKVSMLRKTPSDFAIVAVEDSVVLEINLSKYRKLIDENQDLTNYYINYLEQEWVIRNEKRQIAFATQEASERYLTFLEEYPSLDKRVPQHQIASYLGITPTQLSRLRKAMKN